MEGSGVGALCGVVARNGDVDDAARGYVVREKNRREFNLDIIVSTCLLPLLKRNCRCRRQQPQCLGSGPGAGTHETIVLGEEDGDARVYLADCQGDQHCEGSED